MDKDNYETVAIEVIRFEGEDVITTSNNGTPFEPNKNS